MMPAHPAKKYMSRGISESYLFNAPPNDSISRRYQIKTKIICTLGPMTSSVDKVVRLIRAGMSVARLNFSHGSHQYYSKVIENIREASRLADVFEEVAILLDTKGPEIRTGFNKNGEVVNLEEGQTFTIYTDEYVLGDKNGVSVTYKSLPAKVCSGDLILIDDGLIGMRVEEVDLEKNTVKCTVENSGELGERKGVNLPGIEVDLESVTSKDAEDIRFGVDHEVDFIAASFIRKASDVLEVRRLIEGTNIKVIAKIENRQGLENFDYIYEEADGVMIARGDLGVEVPVEQVFRYQKLAIQRCNMVGKPVITATQMLESMVKNPRPTRAEATDVANAVLDGSDCVMLSGETAKGAFPTKAVEVMFNICREAECDIRYDSFYEQLKKNGVVLSSVGEAIANSAVRASSDTKATLIITLTETGNMARYIAKHRPIVPVIAATSSIKVARYCAILRGIYPFLVQSMSGSEHIVTEAMKWGIDKGMAHPGDPIVVTSGITEARTGSTNMLRILKCVEA